MQSKTYLSSSSYKKEKNILFYACILLRISILISIIFIQSEFNLKSFPCHQQIEIQIILHQYFHKRQNNVPLWKILTFEYSSQLLYRKNSVNYKISY